MKNRSGVLAVKKESVLIPMILICVAVAAPLLFKQQLIAGTIVNATLIVGTYLLGIRSGLIIGLIPSSFALATGLLPLAMAPMVPFIILGNAILVLSFGYLNQFNYWVGVLICGILKSAFLYGTSMFVTSLFLSQRLAPTVAQMMSWPQLFTALAGGIVAFAVIKLTRNWSSISRT